jgi:hypothetical protein
LAGGNDGAIGEGDIGEEGGGVIADRRIATRVSSIICSARHFDIRPGLHNGRRCSLPIWFYPVLKNMCSWTQPLRSPRASRTLKKGLVVKNSFRDSAIITSYLVLPRPWPEIGDSFELRDYLHVATSVAVRIADVTSRNASRVYRIGLSRWTEGVLEEYFMCRVDISPGIRATYIPNCKMKMETTILATNVAGVATVADQLSSCHYLPFMDYWTRLKVSIQGNCPVCMLDLYIVSIGRKR